MIRSFLVAFVAMFGVVVFGARDYLLASQPAQQPGTVAGAGSVPIQFTGATPGTNLELFLNTGKVADVAINSSGQGASILDLLNLGKVQMQVYVDVCQDGKTVKVLVVSGQPPPEDNCKRRMVGAAWWSDCGVTRITLDLTKFGMRVVGCGSFFTENRNWLIPVGAGVAVVPFLGGGDSTTTSTPPTGTTPPATSTTPPVTTTPPATTPPSTTPPTTTPPTTPVTPPVVIDFTVGVTPGYTHPGGNTSIACFLIAASAVGSAPALNQSASYTGTITGPGVVSGGSFSGNLNASGRAVAQAVINAFGNYVGSVTVLFGGVSKQATAQVNVQQAQGTCPQAQ
jgi:hypothetical protein